MVIEPVKSDEAILIVDDVELNRAILSELFQKEYSILEAENGAEALFGLFQRGRPESNVPGAGIGLAIVKSIADLHHGQLSAETRVGGGSCFRLTLPIGQPPQINFEDEA